MSRRSAIMCRRYSALPWMAVLVSCAATVGCGTGAYEETLNATVAKMRHNDTFRFLYPEGGLTPFPGTNPQVSLRLPKLQWAAYNANQPLRNDKTQVPVQPPKFALPGEVVCYEGFHRLEKDSTWYPYSCYLAAVSKTPPVAKTGTKTGDSKPAPTDVLDRVKAAFPGQNLQWEDYPCPAPRETSVAWKRIVLPAEEQQFDTFNSSRTLTGKKLPTLQAIYMYEAPKQYVFLYWRMPSTLVEKVKLLDWAPYSAGTVVIAAEETPPAKS